MSKLTKEEAYAVANFIDKYLFKVIRNAMDIEDFCWLRNICRAYEKLCEYYIGITDQKEVEG